MNAKKLCSVRCVWRTFSSRHGGSARLPQALGWRSIPLSPLASCLHLVNGAFIKLSSIIQLEGGFCFQLGLYSWSTASASSSLSIPRSQPALASSSSRLLPFGASWLEYVGEHIMLLICSVAALVPGWSRTEYSFFLNCSVSWLLFRVCSPSPASQKPHPRRRPHRAPCSVLCFLPYSRPVLFPSLTS